MKKIFINADRDSTQIFEEILDEIIYTSESFSIALEDKRIVVDINNEENVLLYIDYVAGKIATYILNSVEPKIIRDEVELECLDLLDDEIENAICEKVEWELLHKNEQIRQEYFENVKKEIFNGLYNYGNFNLFGFLNFRYKMRRLEIRDYINIALEDYFGDESEEQFISLVRRVVSIQQPQVELINLILFSPNDYEIITDKGQRINIEDVEKILDDYLYDDESLEQQLHLILSVLMTLVPSKIIVHVSEKQDPYISQMLKKIYVDKVTICNSCNFCEGAKLTREEDEE